MQMRRGWTVVLILLCMTSIPASGSLTDQESGGTLYFSCDSDDDCQLTPVPIGEEIISGSVQANPLMPESVALEFDMTPTQTELAVLPDMLDELFIDLRVQGDALGVYTPEMEVKLIIGSSVTTLETEDSGIPSTVTQTGHRWEDEPLNLDQGRLLWPDDVVRARIVFTVDRPSTWELHLRGSSFIELDIAWSENVAAKDVDEPTSSLQPQSTSLEDVHYGALVGDDSDCWSFNVDSNEIMRILIQWEDVPLELQQSNGVHRLRTAGGLQVAAPEVITKAEGDEILTNYRWRALDPGDYVFCLNGQTDRFQPYIWSGVYAVESSGPTDSSEFEGKVTYEAQFFDFSTGEETELSTQSGLFIIPIVGLLVFFIAQFYRSTTSNNLRFYVFFPAVVMLFLSGIVSPLWTMADEMQSDTEWSLEELLDERVQQLWDVSSPATPEATMIEHVGATFGIRDGESLGLWLEIDSAYEREDGRWQLSAAGFDELRIDQLVFSQISDARSGRLSDGLDEQIVQFSIIATRALLLDLMMLEALLVVDEQPTNSIHHIDTAMIATSSFGSLSSPTWSTRPAGIDDASWKRLQTSLYPERITVTLCDCELDLLDLQVDYSNQFDADDTPSFSALRSSNGILPNAGYVAFTTILIGLAIVINDENRRRKAKKLAEAYAPHQTIWTSLF
ncbi:MAG: hypothetical protein ACO3NJ_05925 [Candidatus Poseidoniaceae archaeon]